MASNDAGSLLSASMQVTQENSCLATASSILRVAYWRSPFIRLSLNCAVVMPLRATPTRQKFSGSRLACGEIIERRDHQAMREVAGDAEQDEAAIVGFLLYVGH